MKVLVVDDSKMTCMVAQKTLNSLGINDVLLAGDGAEALALFQQNEVDVIFSDWNMPNMNGLEFLQAVRATNKSVPFIMVTTEGTRDKVASAIQHGVNDYLVKPFTPVGLRAKLAKWVGVTA